MVPVDFIYNTGIQEEIVQNVRLVGSWDERGNYSDTWSMSPISMEAIQTEDGCFSYKVTVNFDSSTLGREMRWGVRLDAPGQKDIWGIPTEIKDDRSQDRYQSFIVTANKAEQYFLTHCHRLGAQKRFLERACDPAIEFSVWAPNAQEVELVVGKYDFALQAKNTGYISDHGEGIDTNYGNIGAFKMKKDDHGIWHTDLNDPSFAKFKDWDHKLYMFRLKKDDGSSAYRTDVYSRCQIGKGGINPGGGLYTGSYLDLDGSKSCSVVIDPQTVTRNFEEPAWPETQFITEKDFWKDEFNPDLPLPRRLEDMVIYELHVGSLGWDHPNRDGNYADVINLLGYLSDLGVNTIELLPVLQFQGLEKWGYGTSHFFALEYATGGRDQLKHLIRECHRRGIALIMDVVYNHYTQDTERAEWMYDSKKHTNNIFYWYEGDPSSYHSPDGGYVDNGSSGYFPCMWEEMVRKMFISSAVSIAREFHIDGFRVDLLDAIHKDNKLHANGREVTSANEFGKKFLREWTRTLKMVKPDCVLIGEDHSHLNFITLSPEQGGLGFDAVWYSDFCHHLIGDEKKTDERYARLLYLAGLYDMAPLRMDYFAGALLASKDKKIVYHECHDLAKGSDNGTDRTMQVAVKGAPLVGETRRYAEARSRFAFGMSMLSAGTPMFLFGEEVGSTQILPYSDFRAHREDLIGERNRYGAYMFKFYQDMIRFRSAHSAIRSRKIDVLHTHNDNRVIAFLRHDAQERFLVVASLNNRPFSAGYWIESDQLADAKWEEVFNSDAAVYGGWDTKNNNANLYSQRSRINVKIPANGFVVLKQVEE